MEAKVIQAASGHSVQLDWQEATPGTSFEIYRALASGQQDYNAPTLASVPAGVFSYLDTQGLVEGDTYYYTALAVDSAGVKSDPSNEASATIPTKPMPPSQLTARAS